MRTSLGSLEPGPAGDGHDPIGDHVDDLVGRPVDRLADEVRAAAGLARVPLVADPGPELAGLRRAVAVPPVPAGPLGLAEEHAELVAALRRDPDERRPLRGPPLADALRPAGRRRLRPGGEHLGGAQPHLAQLLAELLVDALEGFAQVVQA